MKWLLSLHPKLFFIISKNLLSRPGRFKINDKDHEFLSTAETIKLQISTINRAAILKKWGEGKKVLVIHGWAGRGIQLKEHIKKLKDHGHEVTMLDFPAHGEAPGKATSVFEFIHTLKKVISENSFDAFIAHSVGCAALLGSLSSDSETPLVLFAPHYDLYESLTKMMRKHGLKNDFIEKVLRLYEDHYQISFDSFNPKNIAPIYKGKVLIYHDEEDGALPSTHSQKLSDAFADAQYIETKGLGHNRILKDEKIVEEVFRFIEEGTKALLKKN
ncbi:MAG: alpha/beta hydrolase [Bdellovibrionales bacterium]|nr:alpha/beta hydrolase [Bdellovibrionales bacterium]